MFLQLTNTSNNKKFLIKKELINIIWEQYDGSCVIETDYYKEGNFLYCLESYDFVINELMK